MNWHSLLTENANSGLVIQQYCNALTKLLYNVASFEPRGRPLALDKAPPEAMGVEVGLA